MIRRNAHRKRCARPRWRRSGCARRSLGYSRARAVGPSDLPRLNEVHIRTVVLLFTTIVSLFLKRGLWFDSRSASFESSIHRAAEGIRPGLRAACSQTCQWRLGRVRNCRLADTAGLRGARAESFWRLIHVNPGFKTSHVVSARLSLNAPAYDAARREQFWTQLEERMSVRQVSRPSGPRPSCLSTMSTATTHS